MYSAASFQKIYGCEKESIAFLTKLLPLINCDQLVWRYKGDDRPKNW